MIILVILVVAHAARCKVIPVPYHRQFTDYSCGQGSSEMILHASGVDVDARTLMNVERCTSRVGTYSFDIVRACQLSEMTTGQMLRRQIPYFEYPANVPARGIPGRPVGYGAFSYHAKDRVCWHDELAAIVKQGIPVILLMWYDFDPDEGQHYRVAVGVDDTSGDFIFYDPWDRDGDARRRQYNVSTLCRLWDLPEEKYDVVYPPFVGVIAMPWEVDATFYTDADGNLVVESAVAYACPAPFCNPAAPREFYPFVAEDATVTISYATSRFRLLRGAAPAVRIGQFFPRQTLRVKWVFELLRPDEPVSYDDSMFVVEASGVINGSVPRVEGWTVDTYYPAYTYVDRIGGKDTLWY